MEKFKGDCLLNSERMWCAVEVLVYKRRNPGGRNGIPDKRSSRRPNKALGSLTSPSSATMRFRSLPSPTEAAAEEER